MFFCFIASIGQCAISKVFFPFISFTMGYISTPVYSCYPGFFPFISFTMGYISTPVYSCYPDSNSLDNHLYILSVYGNHYAKSTLIDIRGESTKPVVLVLANYYPVTWKVQNHGVQIEKIILVSLSFAKQSV